MQDNILNMEKITVRIQSVETQNANPKLTSSKISIAKFLLFVSGNTFSMTLPLKEQVDQLYSPSSELKF